MNAPGEPEGERFVSLTFDDAWQSVMDHAFPLLQRYGFPATVGPIGNRLLWNPHVRLMDLKALHTVAEHGWEIASHGLHHRQLDRLPVTYADEEGAEWQFDKASQMFRAEVSWADVGCVVDDDVYVPRLPSSEALRSVSFGFFHDANNGVVYVRAPKGPVSRRRVGFRLGSAERELDQSRRILESMGFEVRSLLVPNRQWPDEVREVGRRYYRAMASGDGGLNDPDGPRDHLRRIATSYQVDADALIAKLETRLERSRWAIVCLHGIGGGRWGLTPEDLERLLDWLSASGVTVTTLDGTPESR